MGSKSTERNSGSTFAPTLRVKVWPSHFVLLAVAFDAVAEDFVEEDAGGAAGEDGRADEGFGDGRLEQRAKVGGDAVDGGGEDLFRGQAGGVGGFEGFAGAEVHAVGGFGAGGDDDARVAAAVAHARAFGVDQVARFVLPEHADAGSEHFREAVEARGKRAGARGPLVGGEADVRWRLVVDGGLFGGEIVGVVLLGHVDVGVAADLDEALGGGAVGAVGIEPEAAADGGGVVVDGEGRAGGELRAIAAHAVVVIELGGADAERGIERAGAALAARGEGAQGGGDDGEILLGDFVGQVVGRGVGLLLSAL